MAPDAKQRHWVASAQDGIRLFGVDEADLSTIASAKDRDSAIAAWQDYVASQLRPRYKKLVFDKHPDRGGDHEEFVKVQEAWVAISSDLFARSVWALAQRRVFYHPLSKMKVRVSVQVGSVFTDSTSSATTSFYTGSGHPFVRRY